MSEPAPSSRLELGQLITVSNLNLRLICGSEEDLVRTVSWAHATEMVDPRPHLRGDELVCTVGSSLINAENVSRFVEAVRATGSAAICLGLGEIHTQVPQTLIHACERHSVPLIEMAHGIPFLAINDVVVARKVRAEAHNNERDGGLIGDLLEKLRQANTLEELLSAASGATGGILSYVAPGGVSVTAGVAVTADVSVAQGATAVVELGEGETLSLSGSTNTVDEDLLIHIGRVLQIARRAGAAREGEQRARTGHLFTLVADGLAHVAALVPELQHAGLADSPLVVSAWPADTAPVLAGQFADALIADTGDLTYAVTTSAARVYETADALGLVCGVSSPVRRAEIVRGITEAKATLRLARKRGKVAGPDSLSTLNALLEQQLPSQLVPFVDQLVRPLIAPSVRGGAELLHTLRSYLQHDCSISRTADSGYLHVNTVRHRLSRVHELVGRNPLLPADLVDLGIALWAYDRSMRHVR